MIDVKFDNWPGVELIGCRLHPLDMGYDVRVRRMVVRLPRQGRLVVSCATRSDARRVLAGPAPEVAAALREYGYDVFAE